VSLCVAFLLWYMPHPGEEKGARLFTCDDASLSVEAVLFRSDSPVTCFPDLVSGLGFWVLGLGLRHLLPRFRELLSFDG
jgi:hypothetical protein